MGVSLSPEKVLVELLTSYLQISFLNKMLGLILVLGSGLGLSSAAWGNQMAKAPFAPANDDAWLNYMFWQSLAGKPVESQSGLVDPYDEVAGSLTNGCRLGVMMVAWPWTHGS